MALNVLPKINKRLEFLYRKNNFLSPQLRRLLCNALLQPHFDYACSVWYSNLNKKFKTKLQTLQNKCVRFYLQLDNKAYVGITEFKQINWLPVNYRFTRCLAANVFKFFDEKCPLHMKNVFVKSCTSQAPIRNSTMKLSQPLRRSNYGQYCILFLAPSVCNSLPNELKHCTNLNTFLNALKIKGYFLYKIRQKDNDIDNVLLLKKKKTTKIKEKMHQLLWRQESSLKDRSLGLDSCLHNNWCIFSLILVVFGGFFLTFYSILVYQFFQRPQWK